MSILARRHAERIMPPPEPPEERLMRDLGIAVTSRCPRCDVTWRGAEPCWVCGQPASAI